MILGIFENWAQALEVLGVWLAAGATFLAAYVALHVANRANRQSVKVTAQPMLAVTMGGGAPKSVFYLSATNMGLRAATITGLGAESALKRNSFIVTSPLGSSTIPTTLKDGEAAHWLFPELLPNGESWYCDYASRFAGNSWLIRWVDLRTFRFRVVTSLGNTFYSKPSSEFRKKVLEQMDRLRT